MTLGMTGHPTDKSSLVSPLQDLRKDGYCVIEGALREAELRAFRDTLYRIAEFDRDAGWKQRSSVRKSLAG